MNDVIEKQKYYDLTFSQEIMFIALKYSPVKNLLNIGTSIWFKEEMDVDLLKKALMMSLKRNDALRIRLTEVNKKIQQYFSDEEFEDIPILDYSEKTVEYINKQFDKKASTGYEWKNNQLIHVTIVKAPDNHVAVFAVVNHLVADAWGFTVFMKDALDVYISLRDGEELPEKPFPFEKIMQEELKYKGSEKMAEDFEYWKSQSVEKPVYSAVNPKDVGKEYNKMSISLKSTSKVYKLSKSRVNIINNYCRKVRLSPQVLYIFGVFCYFAVLNNKDQLWLNSPTARRATINMKKASGILNNAIALTIKCPFDLTFDEACERIFEIQSSAFRHAAFPYSHVTGYRNEKFMGKKASPAIFSDISLTFQRAVVIPKKPLKFDVQYHSAGASGMPVYLTIMDIANNGTLDFIYEYQVKRADEDLIRVMYCYMHKAIELGIENPSLTVKEIMDKVKNIDVKEYEAVLLNS